MKNILIVFSLLICITPVISQQYDPPAGTDVFNPDLNKFMGTWQWVSEVDTIKFNIGKENVRLSNTGGMDFLIGYHLYKKSTDTIYSSIQYSDSISWAGRYTMCGSQTTGIGAKNIHIIMSDVLKNKAISAELTLMDSANTQMQFTRTDQANGNFRLDGNKPKLPDYTLPDLFVLLKQNIPPIMAK